MTRHWVGCAMPWWQWCAMGGECGVGGVSEEFPLPASWALAKLDEVAQLAPEVSLDGIDAAAPVHFVPMAAVAEDFSGVDVSALRPLSEVRKGYTGFVSGDVLLAKITPCMENGKGGLVPPLPHRVAFGSTEFHVLRSSVAVSNSWVAWFLSQPLFRKNAKANMSGTAGQMRVPTKWLRAVDLPVPPRAEQTRIVAKLEELLSDLDAGVAELKAAQKKLAQYRQSLLKAAVTGELTAKWRAARALSESGEAENGQQFLQRILTERRAGWEAKQLAKFKAQGKTPPKDWQKKYPEPVQPDTSGLPELPEGWVWASVDQLSESVRNGLSKTPNTTQCGFPIFKINAVRPMTVNFDAIKHIEIDQNEAADYWVEVGDVLATRYNGSVDLLGVFGMIKDVSVRTLYPDKLIRMKPVTGVELGAWMEVCGNVGLSRKHLVSRVKTTAGQTGISGDDLKKTPIPLPPVAEQEVTLAVLKDRLQAVQELGLPIELGLKQSTAQRQNILRTAFAGQLVPQDLADEPASVLLARIRAERAQREAVKKPRGRKPKEAA